MFDNKYTKYWKKTIGNSIDGCKIADGDIVKNYLQYLKQSQNSKVLDLGCSFGRMFPILNEKFNYVIGIDVDMDTINHASEYNYNALTVGTAEDTFYADKFFDSIVSWAVFDVVNQEKSLLECNRILKTGGQLLFTGKNNKYSTLDNNAFIAERNAKLKKFPHSFTDVDYLLNNLDKFGFKLNKCYTAKNRGDLGSNSVNQYKNNSQFYDFILVIEKIVDITIIPNLKFTHEFSDVAKQESETNNFTDVKQYFLWHKNNES